MIIALVMYCALLWASPKTALVLLGGLALLGGLYTVSTSITVPPEYLVIGGLGLVIGAGCTFMLMKGS